MSETPSSKKSNMIVGKRKPWPAASTFQVLCRFRKCRISINMAQPKSNKSTIFLFVYTTLLIFSNNVFISRQKARGQQPKVRQNHNAVLIQLPNNCHRKVRDLLRLKENKKCFDCPTKATIQQFTLTRSIDSNRCC